MKKIILERNIENISNWLKEKPHDEDYKRLLKSFKQELEELENKK